MLVAGAESVFLQTLGSVGEFLAGIGVAVAIGQLRAGRRLAKESRVFDYAARLREPDRIPLIVEAREFWLYGDDYGTEAGLRRWEDMEAEPRHRVIYPLNVLEEIGQAYADKVIDRGLVQKYLRSVAEAYFKEAWWFIAYQRALYRERRLPGVPYERWEQMLKDFQRDIWARIFMQPGPEVAPPAPAKHRGQLKLF